MDPISTIQTLYSLAVSVKTWLDQRREKEETIKSLSTTVNRICDVVAPFHAPTATAFEKPVIAAFMGIGEVLCRTREHLIAYGSKHRNPISAFRIIDLFSPAKAIAVLQQDEKDLNQQLIMALFTIAIRDLIPQGAPTNKDSQDTDRLYMDSIKKRDVADFWRNYVGTKVLWAPEATFRLGIKTQFPELGVDDETCTRMMLSLDEFKLGGVTPNSLQRLVGDEDLFQVVKRFKLSENAPGAFDSAQIPTMKTPLLLWVDDEPSNNVGLIQDAKWKGINVVLINSTASAKEWIQVNEGFLRQNDSGRLVRVISDNSRIEFSSVKDIPSSQGLFVNHSAGEMLVRYLRGQLYRIPILIYCGPSHIEYTRYVESYADVGSTQKTSVAELFINGLAERTDSDIFWRNYNV